MISHLVCGEVGVRGDGPLTTCLQQVVKSFGGLAVWCLVRWCFVVSLLWLCVLVGVSGDDEGYTQHQSRKAPKLVFKARRLLKKKKKTPKHQRTEIPNRQANKAPNRQANKAKIPNRQTIKHQANKPQKPMKH